MYLNLNNHKASLCIYLSQNRNPAKKGSLTDHLTIPTQDHKVAKSKYLFLNLN